jgi:transposase
VKKKMRKEQKKKEEIKQGIGKMKKKKQKEGRISETEKRIE